MLSDDAGELDWLLFHQSDVLTRAQALRFFTESAVRHKLRTRRWRKAHPGVYLTADAAPTWEQEFGSRCWPLDLRPCSPGPPRSHTSIG